MKRGLLTFLATLALAFNLAPQTFAANDTESAAVTGGADASGASAKGKTAATNTSAETTEMKSTPAQDANDTYLSAAAANGANRWPSKRIPITYCIDVNAAVPGYRPSFKTAIETAMKAWTDASGGKVSFTPADANSASLQVKWTDDVKNMNFAQEMGHTEIQVDGDGLYKASIILLSKQRNGSTIDDTFATHVAMHEVGHALGILGHSTSPDDIMYPSTTPAQTAALSKKDIATIAALYSSAGDQFVKKFDAVKMTDFGASATPGLQVMHLNAEGGQLWNKGEYAAALAKLEEALKIEPNNQIVLSNLGSMYGNVGTMAFMMQKPKDAENYFKKSIATLEKCKDSKPLLPILGNYSRILKSTGRLDEANKIDARIRQLSGGQSNK
jgi:hypothetical protein